MLAKMVFASAGLFLLAGANSIAAEEDVLATRTADIEAARRQAQSLVEAHPGDARALGFLGDLLFRQSRFAEAGSAYRRAVEADPHFARGHWGLGRLALIASRRAEARNYFARAFQLDPNDPDIILSYSEVVQDLEARAVLLRTYVSAAQALAWAGKEDRARLEDAAAKLTITERLGRHSEAKLVSPHHRYRLKLARYFSNRGVQR